MRCISFLNLASPTVICTKTKGLTAVRRGHLSLNNGVGTISSVASLKKEKKSCEATETETYFKCEAGVGI